MGRAKQLHVLAERPIDFNRAGAEVRFVPNGACLCFGQSQETIFAILKQSLASSFTSVFDASSSRTAEISPEPKRWKIN
jgi:hypothetical protein